MPVSMTLDGAVYDATWSGNFCDLLASVTRMANRYACCGRSGTELPKLLGNDAHEPHRDCQSMRPVGPDASSRLGPWSYPSP